MPKLKSHLSVQQIAKKHRLDVSFIQNQLDMGEPIEHEHTKDHTLAMNIALQHLDEIPDYYTRLKKMEASAKKEHKKFRDIKEYAEYDGNDDMDSPINMRSVHGIHVDYDKRYCTKCKKVQLRSECKYGPLCWDLFSIPEKLKEGNLHKWFTDSRSKNGKPGWVNVVTGGTCASDEPGEGVPKCVSSEKRASMTTAERRSAARRKKAADPGQQEKSGAAKPTYVSTDVKEGWTDKYKKSIDCNNPKGFSQRAHCQGRKKKMNEESDKKGKGSGKKDACYNKVKSRYDVWPSAYASGALVKCRKVGAANWGTKSEETMQEEERYCPLCDKRETRSECSYGEKAWDKVSVKDHEYSMARSELKTIVDAVKRLQMKVGKGEGDLEAWVQSKITKAADYIDTAADYVASGEMEESISPSINPSAHKKAQKREKIRTLATKGVGGEKDVASKKLGPTAELPKIKEETLVDKIVGEIVIEKCWPGYKKKGMKTMFGKKYPNCVKVEDVTIEDSNGKLQTEIIDLIKPDPIVSPKSTFMSNNELDEATRLQSETGNIIAVILSWRGKTYSIRMFFPQVNMPSKKDVTLEIQKVYPGAIVLQYNISTLQAGMPLIQVVNSKSKNYLLNNGTIGEETIEEVAAWQRKEGKNPEGGLNKKGIASYRREHPGSKLSMAVTTKPSKLKPGSKAAKRRKSFCARMSGMPGPMKDEKGRPTRKALSLRKWNC